MRPRHALAALLLAAVVAASALGGPDRLLAQAPPPPTPTSYLKTWDNIVSPAAPLPLASDATLDVVVHSRDRDTWGGLSPMPNIQHGPACQAPPATHASHTPHRYEDAAFLCSGNVHAMTALNETGYGLIYLTPNHLVDLSSGEAVIRFDVSTFRSSGRDWIDVWVTPYEENLVAPVSESIPDLVGDPRRGVNVELNPNGAFVATHVQNFARQWLPYSNHGYQNVLVPSMSRRDTVEIRLSKTRVKVGMPAYNLTWTDQPLPAPLDWDRGVVQLGHHSYNPEKDCGVANTPGPDGTCKANTWHWDNISISPSVPFTMIRANERAAVAASNRAPMAFTFPQPAPQGAHLRAAVYGTNAEVSTDDGATWAPLRLQPARWSDRLNTFRSYWHPVPAGTSRVLLRAGNDAGQAGVNYAALWSLLAQQPPTPAPVTPTPIPTEVPTATPQDTATPLPTFTPVPPTNTPAPPTSTSIPPTETPVPPAGCAPLPVGTDHQIPCR